MERMIMNDCIECTSCFEIILIEITQCLCMVNMNIVNFCKIKERHFKGAVINP